MPSAATPQINVLLMPANEVNTGSNLKAGFILFAADPLNFEFHVDNNVYVGVSSVGFWRRKRTPFNLYFYQWMDLYQQFLFRLSLTQEPIYGTFHSGNKRLTLFLNDKTQQNRIDSIFIDFKEKLRQNSSQSTRHLESAQIERLNYSIKYAALPQIEKVNLKQALDAQEEQLAATFSRRKEEAISLHIPIPALIYREEASTKPGFP